ncbi:hypothetical protein V8F20_003345 [Naviculisporaceae sp. PSN 640]
MRFSNSSAACPLFAALTLVSASTQGGAVDKRAVAADCDTGSLVGLIEGSWQAAIPFCAQYRALVVTETVTSTTTRTNIRTRTIHTTTTVDGKRKVKARDSKTEATPAPQLQGLGRREGAAEALVQQLKQCRGDSVSIACNAANQQVVITTTTTVLKKTAVTSTTTTTAIATETAESADAAVYFRVYLVEPSGKRGRSTNAPGTKWYLTQLPEYPEWLLLTTNVNKALDFRLSTTPALENSLQSFSVVDTPGYKNVEVYSFHFPGIPFPILVKPADFGLSEPAFPPVEWNDIDWANGPLNLTLQHPDPSSWEVWICQMFNYPDNLVVYIAHKTTPHRDCEVVQLQVELPTSG